MCNVHVFIQYTIFNFFSRFNFLLPEFYQFCNFAMFSKADITVMCMACLFYMTEKFFSPHFYGFVFLHRQQQSMLLPFRYCFIYLNLTNFIWMCIRYNSISFDLILSRIFLSLSLFFFHFIVLLLQTFTFNALHEISQGISEHRKCINCNACELPMHRSVRPI